MKINKTLFKKVTRNFWNFELLPQELFLDGTRINPDWYLTEFLLTVPQKIRDLSGKSVTVNNWESGGDLKNRGLRSPNSTVGAGFSFHKLGVAVDINIAGMSQKEVLEFIIKNIEALPMITTYEDIKYTVGWNHFDGRFTGQKSLLVVAP